MSGRDLSEWQDPATTDYATPDFFIIRTSHGTTEDKHWREHFNNVVSHGKPLGLYHYLELGVPENEASFFHELVGFLSSDQVHYGFWLDVEENQPSSSVNRFRAWVHLPWVGLYANLSSFNSNLREYMHYGLNWLAMPTGTVLLPGWEMPDYILRQDGTVNGIDDDVRMPAQPYPNAWAY
jgi:hypothetical protein